MRDLGPADVGRSDERVVERRGREQQVDADKARDEAQVLAELRRRPIRARQVFPNRRHVVLALVVVDDPVVRPRLRARGQIVEPGARRGATPRDDLARRTQLAEVVFRVGIGLVGLGVDVEAEVLPPEPVDEEDRVAALVVALRTGEIAFDGRRVDVQNRSRDVEDVVELSVVLLLKHRRWTGDARCG